MAQPNSPVLRPRTCATITGSAFGAWLAAVVSSQSAAARSTPITQSCVRACVLASVHACERGRCVSHLSWQRHHAAASGSGATLLDTQRPVPRARRHRAPPLARSRELASSPCAWVRAGHEPKFRTKSSFMGSTDQILAPSCKNQLNHSKAQLGFSNQKCRAAVAESGWSGSDIDFPAPRLRPSLQCWEFRPLAAGHSPTIKGSDAATVYKLKRASGSSNATDRLVQARCPRQFTRRWPLYKPW